VNPGANQLDLNASIAELNAMRYTPAGVPALDLRLEHESLRQEAGQERQVKASVKAVAFGALAEGLPSRRSAAAGGSKALSPLPATARTWCSTSKISVKI